MEKKLKKKRIRNIIIALLAIALIAVIAVTLNVEKAEPEKAAPKTVSEEQEAKDKPEKKESEKKEEKKKEETAKKEKKQDKEKKSEDKAKKTGKKKKAKKTGSTKKSKEEKIKVSVYIECKKLSGHMDKLENESIRKYIPSSGVIVSKTKYTLKKGSNAYDLTYRVCRDKNVQIETSYSAVYDSRYVEGIGYIYEMDAGPDSGWMYRVNGRFPDYGCSQYRLKDGDSVVWSYTCNGGKDLGK